MGWKKKKKNSTWEMCHEHLKSSASPAQNPKQLRATHQTYYKGNNSRLFPFLFVACIYSKALMEESV